MENIILQEEVWKAEPEDEDDDDEDNVKEVHLDEGIEYKIVNMTKEAENKKKGNNESSVVHSKTVQMKNHSATGNTTHHTAAHNNVHGEQHGKFEAPHHNVTQHHVAPLSEEQKKSMIIHVVLGTLFLIVFIFCCCTCFCKKKQNIYNEFIDQPRQDEFA